MKYMLLIALGLLVGSAVGYDWLGTPVYASPYYYPYYYTDPTYDAGIYYNPYTDYNAYMPYYTYADYNTIPVYSGNYLIPHTYAKWWPSHEDLDKTLSIAQTRSSMRVYSGGFWTSPGL